MVSQFTVWYVRFPNLHLVVTNNLVGTWAEGITVNGNTFCEFTKSSLPMERFPPRMIEKKEVSSKVKVGDPRPTRKKKNNVLRILEESVV